MRKLILAVAVSILPGAGFAQGPEQAMQIVGEACFYYGWIQQSECLSLTVDTADRLLSDNAVTLAIRYCGSDDLAGARSLLAEGKAKIMPQCEVTLGAVEAQ